MNFIEIDYVHLLDKGKIIKNGNAALATQIESQGFAAFLKEQIWDKLV